MDYSTATRVLDKYSLVQREKNRTDIFIALYNKLDYTPTESALSDLIDKVKMIEKNL